MKRAMKIGAASIGITAWAGFAPLQAQNQVQLVGQNTLIQQSAPPATLQVTGTAQSFNLLVSRADVQDILKAVFDQGQRQFTLDAGITGQVTLRLVNQPLKSVLETICRQTYLKYQVQNNVFVFSRDEDAVRRAIMQLRALNTQLREQLRGMGLDVPPEANFYAQNGVQGQSGFGRGYGGGFGGGVSGPAGPAGNGSGVYPYAPTLKRLQVPPGTSQELLGLQKGSGGRAGRVNPNGFKADVSKRGDSPEQGRDLKSEPLAKQDAGTANAPGNAAGVNGDTAYNLDAYSLLLKDNGLYGVNTQGEQVPVSDILTELGRQSGVTILLDPDIPKDTRFRLRGKLPPRTFDETLNYIATMSRLELRRLGNTVIVSPTPEFQLFFGAETQPRLSYPNTQNLSRGRVQEPSATKDVKKPTDDKTKSAPEKPKDEKEKGKGKEPR